MVVVLCVVVEWGSDVGVSLTFIGLWGNHAIYQSILRTDLHDGLPGACGVGRLAVGALLVPHHVLDHHRLLQHRPVHHLLLHRQLQLQPK